MVAPYWVWVLVVALLVLGILFLLGVHLHLETS